MKGEVPAKGTSPFFLIIIKFGTFFTHFEMILLYPEPYLSYFWCRIKRNRTNIMKITIKYICTGLSLCACTCLVNNLPAQAETTNTAAVSATETGKASWKLPGGWRTGRSKIIPKTNMPRANRADGSPEHFIWGCSTGRN